MMRLCSIASGSSGNCIYAGSDHTGILLDAGISGKRVEQGLASLGTSGKELSGILITHEHADHICGLGVLARRLELPIYATRGTIDAIRKENRIGKVPDDLFTEIRADHPFHVGDLTILPFRTSHDAAEPVGYRLEHGKKSAAIATDLGIYDSYIISRLQNLDVLLLESNYDVRMLETGIYPYYLKQRILGNRGHLSNEMAGRLLCELLHDNMKHIFLGHLSKENNYPALAFETVSVEVTMGDNPYKAKDFDISVAGRDEISKALEF